MMYAYIFEKLSAGVRKLGELGLLPHHCARNLLTSKFEIRKLGSVSFAVLLLSIIEPLHFVHLVIMRVSFLNHLS